MTNLCRLHSQVSGAPDAPCLVLLTGLGMSLKEWPDDFIAALSRDWRVIRLDNRDAGQSPRAGADLDLATWQDLLAIERGATVTPGYDLSHMAADVLASLDRLGAGPAAVLGFSMGGMIAQHLALAAPDRIRALALLSSSPAPGPFPAEATRRFRRLADPDRNDSERAAWLAEDIMYFTAPAGIAAPIAREQARQMLIDGFTQGGFVRQYVALRATYPWVRRLAALQMPTLIAGGIQDSCLPVDHVAALAKAMPRATLARIGLLGHSLEPTILQQAARWLSSERCSQGPPAW